MASPQMELVKINILEADFRCLYCPFKNFLMWKGITNGAQNGFLSLSRIVLDIIIKLLVTSYMTV